MTKKDINKEWEKFDKEFLLPFEEKGKLSTNYGPATNDFPYLDVRFAALKAFETAFALFQEDNQSNLKKTLPKEITFACPICGDHLDHRDVADVKLEQIQSVDDIAHDDGLTILKELWYCPYCDSYLKMVYELKKIVPLKEMNE